MALDLVLALLVLVAASLLAGYWFDDLFDGCRAAVLSYCVLVLCLENRHPALTLAGLNIVICMYAAFFAACLVLKVLRSQIVARRNRRLAEEYDRHH